jgi:hypothetical protein
MTGGPSRHALGSNTPVSTQHLTIDRFNCECFCISLDEQALRRGMAAEVRLSIG